ncbi:MAG: TetR/AcrR family transcriptional regulator [Lachnospiraceae bacterium]|jgi:AcrR family transcriptional regulator|nr:TetR/AcrR family transcriptional regulator [Lachnospiraceae bacterium]MCI1727471.1 TetR/AcrR family transcriptional regulator [Lachnospiraceae bacterium]
MNTESLNEEVLNLKKEKLIRISADLFLKKGIDSVRMVDIAEAAGIGVASLYRYFGTRTAIAIEAGSLLWKDVQKQFSDTFSSDSYQKQTGYSQIESQYGFMLKFYRDRPEFVRFLDAFDRLMLTEKVPVENLAGYEASIFDLEKMFLDSCERGLQDGSIRPGLDYRTAYLASAHAMNALAEKIARGPILSGDDFSSIETEPAMLMKLLLYYLKADQKRPGRTGRNQ